MIAFTFSTVGLVFVAGLAGLVLLFGGLVLADFCRHILRTTGIDLIELQTRYHSARLDREERADRHAVMLEAAGLVLERRRRQLPKGGQR